MCRCLGGIEMKYWAKMGQLTSTGFWCLLNRLSLTDYSQRMLPNFVGVKFIKKLVCFLSYENLVVNYWQNSVQTTEKIIMMKSFTLWKSALIFTSISLTHLFPMHPFNAPFPFQCSFGRLLNYSFYWSNDPALLTQDVSWAYIRRLLKDLCTFNTRPVPRWEGGRGERCSGK